MDVRCQFAAVFDLNRCTGCQACDMACKVTWTNGPGTEYMRWINVEYCPGAGGVPEGWTDREKFKGGWRETDRGLQLRMGRRWQIAAELFHNPSLPVLEDYPLAWEYRYSDPTASHPLAVTMACRVTGEIPECPPGGVGRAKADSRDGAAGESWSRGFDLPRLCNHCLNPACVAACPSGALFKRAEDGIVLVDPTRCRGWKACVSACPYGKVFFNWDSAKAEKCTYCYPLLESDRSPLCFQACGTDAPIAGFLFYDADRIEETAAGPLAGLLPRMRELLLDPAETLIAELALRNGIPSRIVESARRSRLYRAVVDWKIALPLYPDHRTLPMVYYLPPLGDAEPSSPEDPDFGEKALEDTAALFSPDAPAETRLALERLLAVRDYRKSQAGDPPRREQASRRLRRSGLSPDDGEEIIRWMASTGWPDA